MPNILLIIADDIGIDPFNGFSGFGTQKAKTPTLDKLAQNGLLFTQVYANPLCSPTRATILSGQYGFRTGVTGLPTGNAGGIKTTTTSIQQLIEQKTADSYADAVIGKWHLSDNSNGGASNPNNMGIDYFAGFLSGAVQNFSSWSKVVNGRSSSSTTYTTTDFTDESINWIKQQTKPWFLWLAHNAAHSPFHTPPSSLISTTPANNNLSLYLASIEAMDSEINRLLQNIPKSQLDNTIIIFIGDNGTPDQVAQSPFTRSTAKSTLFEGGIRVPMIVSGKGVTRRGTDASLLNSTDLFATIADVAGANITAYQDAKSFKSLFTDANSFNRDWVYSEINAASNSNDENGEALRDKQYKYMKMKSGLEYLFDLSTDPTEKINIIKDTKYQSIKTSLADKLSALKK
jgi:arylsulfatase A-like enzyme